MKYVEQAGLVKFDFLGLTTLTILQRAVRYLRHEGIDVDLDSAAARRHRDVRDARAGRRRRGVPVRRPGHARRAPPDAAEPLRGSDRGRGAVSPRPDGQHPRLLPAQARREAWAPPHPELMDILGETYGIMVYQEQVMQIAQKMGGYSLGLGGPAAPGDGQEDPRGDGRATKKLRRRCGRARHPARQGRGGVRPHGQVRRLRLQQERTPPPTRWSPIRRRG